MDEPAFIAALRGLATHPAARGLADDCAVLELGGETLVLTHDALAEGVHFLPGADPADVAWRLVATTLSDLAAKGARPLGVLLGYMLGDETDEGGGGDARFVGGLAEALAHYATPLLGGDTIRPRPGAARGFALTAIGRATHRPVPSRGGAQAGDGLWVTGTIGAAMLGYEALVGGTDDAARTLAYRRPRALLAQGVALAPHVSAMMDVSDGLLRDAAHIARASGVTLAIDAATVPLAVPEARRQAALRWGDDYQLLFTAPAGFAPAALPVALAIPITRIGSVVARGPAPLLLSGVPLDEGDGLGYQH